MFEYQENKNSALTTFLLVALFFICTCGFSKNSTTQKIGNSAIELASDLHSSNSAILSHQKFSAPERTELQNENFSFKYFNKVSELITVQHAANQKFSIISQNFISIKPLCLSRFYFYFHILSSDDLPFLS